jgi:hypothetical protein
MRPTFGLDFLDISSFKTRLRLFFTAIFERGAQGAKRCGG